MTTVEQLHQSMSRLFPTAYWVHAMEMCAGTFKSHCWKVLACLHGGANIDLTAPTPEALLSEATARAEKIYGPRPEHVGGCV